VHAPALGEHLDQVQTPAAGLRHRPVAGRRDEADALVDDLDVDVLRLVRAQDQLDAPLAAVLHGVGDQLGDQELGVGEDRRVERVAEALDGPAGHRRRLGITFDLDLDLLGHSRTPPLRWFDD
jgi:hypothetical protein